MKPADIPQPRPDPIGDPQAAERERQRRDLYERAAWIDMDLGQLASLHADEAQAFRDARRAAVALMKALSVSAWSALYARAYERRPHPESN